MKKKKSTTVEKTAAEEPIVKLPRDRKKEKSNTEPVDSIVVEVPEMEDKLKFESELKMEVFQELIKAARKKRKLSQKELGHLIGVRKAQISKLEKGYDNASISTMAKVFKALQATVKIVVEMDGQQLELSK